MLIIKHESENQLKEAEKAGIYPFMSKYYKY